jgi:vitamin B12/bleomycin/antimicrobial peptide transport system ATP-binding/permease protein
MNRIDRQFFRDAWELTKPYWSSEERRSAWVLLGAIVALNLFQVYLQIWLIEWRGLFFNALQRYNEPVFWHQLLRFCVWAVIAIAAALSTYFCTQLLQIHWRRWMTERYVAGWLDRKAYYRIQIESANADNPDQRISDDLRLFTQLALSLSIGLFSSAITLVSFISILWVLSGPLTLPLGSLGHVTIPGYAAVGAIVYAGIGTWATVKIGRPLVGLTYNQQRFEADFRYSLVRVRENSESIAFYHGEPEEKENFGARFQCIYGNFIAILIRQMKLTILNVGYNQVAVIVPYVVAAPKFFGKVIEFGGIQQIATAFSQVQTSLSFIVNSYSDIAQLQAVMFRLTQFSHRLTEVRHEEKAITIEHVSAGGLEVKQLDLNLPNGEALRRNIQLRVPEGARLLITGATGAGKSTLLRAISGIWPFGRGHIRSSARRALFLPQKPYLPIGTLRSVLLYPFHPRNLTDSTLTQALTTVGLGKLKNDLDREENWSQRLSGGEAQRIAFAQIILHRPDMIFLDEATSALDEPSEEMLYRVVETLPNKPTIISVAHRSSLKKMHDGIFQLSEMATAA